MNTPRRPHPLVDADSRHVLQHAIQALGRIRGHPRPLTDPGPQLALTQSLILQADHHLAELAEKAHRHGYTQTDQRHFLGLDDPALWQPY